MSILDDYQVIPDSDKTLYMDVPSDATSKRDAKIAQYKKEKELRAQVEVRTALQ